MAYQKEKLPALCPEGEVDEVGEKLLAAAELIHRHGHAKHVLEDRCGRLCVHGAILKAMFATASYNFNGRWEDFMRVTSRLKSIVGPDEVFWNNASERTADQVISALTRAAYNSSGA